MLATDIEIELAAIGRLATKNQRSIRKILHRHILRAGFPYAEEKASHIANDKPDEHNNDEKNSENDGYREFEAEDTDVLPAVADESLTFAQVTLPGLPLAKACNDMSEERHLQKLLSYKDNEKREIYELHPVPVPVKISLITLSIGLHYSLDLSTSPFGSRSTGTIPVFNRVQEVYKMDTLITDTQLNETLPHTDANEKKQIGYDEKSSPFGLNGKSTSMEPDKVESLKHIARSNPTAPLVKNENSPAKENKDEVQGPNVEQISWQNPPTKINKAKVYFIIIYLFMLIVMVTPILHLEIFVGQYCQAGIIKACQFYGPAYEGVGVVVVFISVLFALQPNQRSYINLKHMWNLASNPASIVSCRKTELNDPTLANYCTSTYDTKYCKDTGQGVFFYGDNCTNDVFSIGTQIKASSLYYEHLTLPPNADFDLHRLFYSFFIYCSLALWGVCGFKVIRIVAALSYVLFAIFYIITAIQYMSIAKFGAFIGAILDATNAEVLFNIETYIFAFHASILALGVGTSGILCTSSFRNKNNDTFALTYGIMANHLVVATLSIFMYLSIISSLGSTGGHFFGSEERVHGSSDFSKGHHFVIATVTEVLMENNKSTFWAILHIGCMSMIGTINFCGHMLTICAEVRDRVEHHRQLWTAWALIAFCLMAFLMSVPRSITSIGAIWDQVLNHFTKYMLFLTVAMMVIVFVLIYGTREYAIDLLQLYPIKDGYRPWNSPAHPFHLKIFDFVVFILLTLMVAYYGYSLASFDNDAAFVVSHILIGVILASIIGCFAYNAYGSIKKDEAISMLFFVTPEHPSYWRITSLGNGMEEVSGELVSPRKMD
ncbi:unnamed protein product [Cylicocyclus nassatus]|uniref:Uncharacterized protein n=1 Tax=Cylicocyclus nassatus TaxID=53992 RepID=A0AA36GWU5_CYLNA|nr:unnamed protein product [Cylicocyclus nassatus]